jgi:hypothetical protein
MFLFRWLEGRAKMRGTVNTSVIIRRGGQEYNSMKGGSAMRILIANDDGFSPVTSAAETTTRLTDQELQPASGVQLPLRDSQPARAPQLPPTGTRTPVIDLPPIEDGPEVQVPEALDRLIAVGLAAGSNADVEAWKAERAKLGPQGSKP